jgi:SAM-dependent methyltransferase
MTLTSDISNVANAHSPAACVVCGEPNSVLYLAAPDRFHGRSQMFQLVRCPRCSLVWLDSPPLPEEMGTHYGVAYDRSVAAAGDDLERWRDRRDVLLRYKSGGTLLDLGCSAGGFLDSMKGPSWKLCGIEMSPAVAARATARTGAAVFVGDILDAPFLPHSFDAITCFHVFEHLYNPLEVLRKVAEWLKPDGVFYTFMPNIESAGARLFKSYWYALELPRHLYHFSPRSLKALAHSAGLEEVSVTTDREVFIEASTRYFIEEKLKKVGVSRPPLADAVVPVIPVRIVRKMFRLTLLQVLNGLASFAGEGESIHAIFRKASSQTGKLRNAS